VENSLEHFVKIVEDSINRSLDMYLFITKWDKYIRQSFMGQILDRIVDN
jgi:hypothetical protein